MIPPICVVVSFVSTNLTDVNTWIGFALTHEAEVLAAHTVSVAAFPISVYDRYPRSFLAPRVKEPPFSPVKSYLVPMHWVHVELASVKWLDPVSIITVFNSLFDPM